MALLQVYRAENEFMANTIKDLLETNGIPAMIHSFQIPAYDGIAQVMRPIWGEVLVEEEDAATAKKLIEGFLAPGEQHEPTDEPSEND
ncbi:MAG: putative signal transducing protein [bacterium]